MDNYDEVPFKATNYDYSVTLGVVVDRDCVSWSHNVRCDEWRDVEALVEMWREARDFPAVEVEIDYIPHRLPEGTDTGV